MQSDQPHGDVPVRADLSERSVPATRKLRWEVMWIRWGWWLLRDMRRRLHLYGRRAMPRKLPSRERLHDVRRAPRVRVVQRIWILRRYQRVVYWACVWRVFERMGLHNVAMRRSNDRLCAMRI